MRHHGVLWLLLLMAMIHIEARLGTNNRFDAATGATRDLFARNANETDNVFDRSPPGADGDDNHDQGAGGGDETLCLLDDQGLYGDANAARNNGARGFVINFLYQASLVVGTTLLEINSEVLPDVDRAVVTAILPDFFDCTEVVRRILQPSNRQLQSGTVESISARPLDYFVQRGLDCPKIVPDTDCYVVQGYATVMASGVLDRTALENRVKGAIQTAFQDGSVARAITAPQVVDVAYLTDDLQIVPPFDSIPTPSPTEAVGTSPPTALMTASPSAPIGGITFAPVSVQLPTQESLTMIPTSPSSALDTMTGSSTPAPSINANATDAPVASPTTIASSPGPNDKRKKKIAPWWVWLLTGIGAAVFFLVLLTLYDYVQERKAAASVRPDQPKQHRRSDDDRAGDDAKRKSGELEGVYFPPPSRPVDKRPGRFNIKDEDDDKQEDQSDSFVNGYDDDENDDVVEYEDGEETDGEDQVDEDDVYHAEDDEYLDELGELEDFGDINNNEGTVTSYIEEEVSSETAFNLNVQKTKGFVTA